MRKLAITAILSLLSASLSATTLSGGPQSVFMIALENGTATAPLDSNGQYSVAISAIRERTGDNGPVVVLARRIASFKEQPRCGRVAFIVAQPSSHTAWTDMGGELNICDDGNPPCVSVPPNLASSFYLTRHAPTARRRSIYLRSRTRSNPPRLQGEWIRARRLAGSGRPRRLPAPPKRSASNEGIHRRARLRVR